LTRSLRGCALHLSPPFTITVEQIDAIVDALRRALDVAERRLDSEQPTGRMSSS
jgi:adenosylmethionine-8-amino-7-oxononanoate aminotransferase